MTADAPESSSSRGRRLLWAIVVLGIICRVTQYLWRRSYWHDESYLVLNIVGANVRDAFGPLKLLQAAPPFFVIGQIYSSRIFGTSEYALRLVPLLLGCTSVAMMAVLCRRLAGLFAACLATAMFALSDRLIWHSAECKQYSGDVLIALLLLLLATGRDDRGRFVLIAVSSCVLVWFSHTTMFVFGAISLTTLAASSWTRGTAGRTVYLVLNALFAASLVGLYVTSIRPQQYPEMYDYWQHDFVPWSRPLTVPFWSVRMALSLANYASDNAGPLVMVTAILGAISWYRAGRRRELALLWVPLGLNVVASALHRFPFSGTRVTLYAAPTLLLFAAVGAERLVRAAAMTRWSRLAWLVPGYLVAIGLIPAAYALVVPRHRGHVRPSAEFIAAHRTGDEPIYVVGRVEPWQCYLTDPTIRWKSIPADAAAGIDDPSFWAVYAWADATDVKRSGTIVATAARSATATASIEVRGSTAVHFERVASATTRSVR